MKKIFLIMLMGLSLCSYSQPEKNEITFLENLFLKKLDVSKKNVQTKENFKRELTPFVNAKNTGFIQYLLTEKTEENEVTGSLYIISKKGIDNDFDLFKIKLNETQVIYFDKLSDGENETNNGRKSKMTVKYKESEFGMNEPLSKAVQGNLDGEGEGMEICIDHWWVTYVVETGEVLDIELLGSDCFYVGGGSGGGGGGNPPPTEPVLTCEEKTEMYANEGSGMSGPVTEEGEIFISDYKRKKSYNWKIYSAGSWGLLSYEEGIVERVHYPGTSYQYRWEYVEFNHKRIAAVGMNVGGTRTFEDLGATINISPTKTKASVRIDFSVTSKILDTPIPCPDVTIPYNANTNFYCVQVEVN